MTESKWAEKLIDRWKDRNISSQIQELQGTYRRWVLWCIIITAAGAGMMGSTANPRIIAFGLFLSITGMANGILMKIWLHIKLATLRVIWELQEKGNSHTG